MMQKYKLKILLIAMLVFIGTISYSQALLNNGGLIQAEGGAYIYVNGSVLNDSNGEIEINEDLGVNAELYVIGDITNDAIISDDGHIRLLGNWFDNNTFDGGTGTVFFEGADQILGGTSATVFNNLTLDGTGLKTQTIDKYASGILDLKHLELQTETNVFYVENTNAAAIIRTTGFVSSLNGGKLSRKTNSASNYLFPVGSSLGVARYRPVEITPNTATNNTYNVRLANLESSLEGYDVNNLDSDVCEVNPLFYHQIDRSSGSSTADIIIYFDELSDGNWEGISNWNIMPPQWEIVTGSYVTSGSPEDYATKTNWDDFSNEPYILHRNIIPVTFNDLGPFCTNSTPSNLPLSSIEGIAGTWSPATINTTSVGVTDYVFTPNASQVCSDTYTMSIEIEDCCNISLTVNVNDVLCYGDNGQITFSSSGGQLPLTYTVNGINTVSPFFGPAGNYIIVVTDNLGCTEIVSVEINQADLLQFNVISTSAQCGGTGGSVYAEQYGGVSPYSFEWSNMFSGSTQNNLDPGSYSVVATDENGCTASKVGNVGISGALSPSINQLYQISCPNDADAIIEAVCLNAAEPVSYLWNGGETSSLLTNVGAGTYIVNVTDDWGCVGIASTLLVNPQSMQISSTINNVQCYNENNGSVIINVLGGTNPYSYNWSNSFDDNQNTDLVEGEYFVTITDANSCSIIDSFNVTQPEELVLVSQVNDVSCFGYIDGSVEMIVSGGVEPFNYTISGNNQVYSGDSFVGLPTGNYILTVYDQNNCVDSTQIIINEPSQISASYFSQGPSCIGNNDGYIEVNAVGGTAPYLYGWNGNIIDIPLLSGLTQGSYNVSIVDANNCMYEIQAVNLTDTDVDCIRIPNAFTPNEDGVNDTWIIENLEIFSSAYVYVYNRWGQVLYTGRPGEEWDGKFNDRLVPTTSYLYVIELNNGADPYVGIVTVVY